MTVDKDKLNNIFILDKTDKHVAILIQNPPDPDCLGAAAAFKLLLSHVYELETKIYHFGEVSHPQNKSMVNVLQIDLVSGEEIKPDSICKTVVLDTDLMATGFRNKDITKVDVRIDHHNMDRDEPPELKDIRPVGSTCSIVWEYLKAFEVPIQDHPLVATALILGIKTDTLDFTSSTTSDLDMSAFHDLIQYVDRAALAKVTNFPLPKSQFEVEVKAFESRHTHEGVLLSFIGEITEHNRDMISTIADRFARMDTISTVVIMAVVNNYLVASVRSQDSRVSVSKLCSEVFGKKYSGAKEGSGGAKIPLGTAFELTECKSTRDAVMGEIVSSIKHKVFESLGEN